MDLMQKMFSIFVGAMMTYIVSLLCLYAFSAKEFKGYYLGISPSGAHSIYINWENAPDERVYLSYNQEELLSVFKDLQSEGEYHPR